MRAFSTSSIRLWQLISPTLPVGTFCYSQALEYAVETGWLIDENTAAEWILGQIKNNLSQLDVPVFFRLYDAWQSDDREAVCYWNDVILASREAAELFAEDCTLGRAMKRLLDGLDVSLPELETENIAFVTAFSFACQHWSIDRLEAAHGLLWSWCENQVAAAIKLVPLGQTSGQRILSLAIDAIALAIENGRLCGDENIGLSAPGLAIASALHETQYSRLFRS
jgi:urease accessory protein